MSVSLVWFKRDLRISDNQALLEAVNSQLPVICLFNIEPDRLHRSDVDSIHIEWELDCLRELRNSLEYIGGKLYFQENSKYIKMISIINILTFKIFYFIEI